MRRFLSLALLLVVAVLGACTEPAGAKNAVLPEKKLRVSVLRTTRVETAHLQRTVAKLEIILPGEVEGSRDASLAAPMGGFVERVLLREGDEVKSGDTIAWIDRSVYDAHLEAAQARLDQANSELALTQRAGKSLTQARRDAARFNARAAEAQHRLASVQASRARVRAPFDGVIARSRIERGEVLPPGGLVARVVQLDPIHVSATVSDRDIIVLRKGMAAHITTSATSGVFSGIISAVSPAADLNTRAFEIEIRLENPNHELLPGMIAQVSISVDSGEEAYVLPQYVLVTRRDGNGVFVAEDEVARWRPLELGRILRDQIVVEGGLNGDEEIIVVGHRELVDGDRLSIVRTGQCCTDGRIVYEAD